MGVEKETYFPRGGAKPSFSKGSKLSYKTLYGTTKFKRRVQKKPKQSKYDKKNKIFPKPSKPKSDAKASKDLTTASAERLCYKNIQEGMIVLGAIREVQQMHLSISLPGRISGQIPITHISTPYRQMLKTLLETNVHPSGYKSLKEMFEPGQYVVCNVVQVGHAADADLHEVKLSLNPESIQSDKKHNMLTKDTFLVAAVSAIEDHGYVMDVGIKNCRAFLPKSNVDVDYGFLGVGQILWCSVIKSETTSVASTIKLTTIKNQVFNSYPTEEATLNYLTPGMMVDFKINKILSDGLQGTFLNNYTGYINVSQFAKSFGIPSSFEVGQSIQARLLYTMPTIKLSYFTLKSLDAKEKICLKEGHTAKATITSHAGKGFYIKISKTEKGYVSYQRLRIKQDSTDINKIKTKYAIGSTHQCRVLGYDYMEQIYICTFEKDLITDKYFTVDKLELGQLVTITVDKIKDNGLMVSFGRIKGFIPKLHVSDIPLINITNAIIQKFSVGQQYNARVLNINADKFPLLTLKPSLVHTKLPCLTSYEMVQRNTEHDGYIIKIMRKGITVAFFGNVKGWIPASLLSTERIKNPEEIFHIGQMVKCTVVKYNSEKLSLSLLGPKMMEVKIGNRENCTVTSVRANGLEVKFDNSESDLAVIPKMHLTEHPSLATALLDTYSIGDQLNNILIVNVRGVPTLSIRESKYFNDGIYKYNELKVGSKLRCSVQSKQLTAALLQSPIKNFSHLIVVPKTNFGEKINYEDIILEKFQPLIVSIKSINKEKNAVKGTVELSKCLDGPLKERKIQLLESYLTDFDRIKTFMEKSDAILGTLSLGENISGVITSVNDSGSCLLQLENSIECFVPAGHTNEKAKKNSQVKGVVLWFDYNTKRAIVSLLPAVIKRTKHIQNHLPEDLQDKEIKVTIVFIDDNLIIAVPQNKTEKYFIYLPMKKHYNDFTPDTKKYKIGDAKIVTIVKTVKNYVIGKIKIKKSNENVITIDPKNVKIKKSKTIENRKRKTSQSETDETESTKKKLRTNESKEEKEKSKKQKTTNGIEIERKKSKSLEKNTEKKEKLKKNEESNKTPVLSGADNFWDLKPEMLGLSKIDEDSADEEESSNQTNGKKKKTTAAERVEIARKEEDRLREIEDRLADTATIPTSADEFDRLVLSKPNSSFVWVNYMVYHLQATEIDKARAVARKALSTISFREEQEKLNVWVALLNLENNHGTNESFTSVLEEAAQMNDALAIRTRAMGILADSGKQSELQELIKTVLRKHKHMPEAWLQTGTAYFRAGMIQSARSVLQRALTSLDKRHHIDLIVKFAFLESKNGDSERAEALFEQVLALYPRRIDIWSVYVDLLIGTDRIDIARKVLERSTALKLPARKMKTMFKKFLEFEQKYGDAEAVERVRKLATDYVESSTL